MWDKPYSSQSPFLPTILPLPRVLRSLNRPGYGKLAFSSLHLALPSRGCGAGGATERTNRGNTGRKSHPASDLVPTSSAAGGHRRFFRCFHSLAVFWVSSQEPLKKSIPNWKPSLYKITPNSSHSCCSQRTWNVWERRGGQGAWCWVPRPPPLSPVSRVEVTVTLRQASKLKRDDGPKGPGGQQ